MSSLLIYDGKLNVQSIVHALASERGTFHVFKVRGRRLLYDINSGVLLTLEPAAYDLLRGIEAGTSAAELEGGLLSALPGEAEQQALLAEILRLRAAGLFELEPLESESERSDVVDGYVGHRPRKMMLLIQTSCNLRCTYCYEVQSQFHQTGGAMPMSVAMSAVDALIARSGRRRELEITFFGGEPLLNFSGLKKTVEYAKAAGAAAGKSFYFQMTTNGVLLSDAVIEYLVSERIGVMVSLDGDAAQNDTHRVDHRGKGVGAEVVENVRRLVDRQRAAGLRIAKVRATLTRQNPNRRAVAEYFREQGFDRANIGASMGRAESKQEWDLPWEETPEQRVEADKCIDAYILALEKGERPPAGADYTEAMATVASSLKNPRRKARVACGVGRNMLAYTGNGTLYPCHRYAGEEAYQIGTVAEGIDREKLDKFYREILAAYDDHCSHCFARNLCGGQCPWYVSRQDGHVGKPDKASCDSLRNGFERQLWLYSELVGRGLIKQDSLSKETEEDAEEALDER